MQGQEKDLNTSLMAQISANSLQLKDLGYKPFKQGECRADVSLGSVDMEHGEMNGISLDTGEGPSLGGKDTKKLEAKLENIELCPGPLLYFQMG